MDTKKIDLLNIALLIVSLIVAIIIPFKIFLFSYAILGPLHYLTEISWLKERNFFIKSKKNWAIAFIILAIILSIYPVIKFLNLELNQSMLDTLKSIGSQVNILLLVGFLFAVSLIFFNRTKQLIIALFVSFIIAYVLNNLVPSSLLFIGIFLPTLIHVYIFTLLFIIYGAIKAKSKYGFLLAVLLFFVPLIIIFLPINQSDYLLSKETIEVFKTSKMQHVSGAVARLLNQLQNGTFHPLSIVGIKIQVFIGFAYTYHYLNWFSKTSIIGWRKALTVKKSILILFIWLASVALYIYNPKTGFIALFFLSFLHVFLEFPLNAITIREVLTVSKKKI